VDTVAARSLVGLQSLRDPVAVRSLPQTDAVRSLTCSLLRGLLRKFSFLRDLLPQSFSVGVDPAIVYPRSAIHGL